MTTFESYMCYKTCINIYRAPVTVLTCYKAFINTLYKSLCYKAAFYAF